MADLTQIHPGGFNAADHEDDSNGDLPAGQYYIEVEKAEMRKTKNGQGIGLSVQFNVVGSVADPEAYKGRKLFEWFNLQHSNPKAQQIGNAQFAALCKAMGKPSVNDTDELLGQFAIAVVKVKNDEARIAGYKPATGQEPPAVAAPAPAAPTPPPAAAAAKMPWQ